MPDAKKVFVDIALLDAGHSKCFSVDDTRVAGPKPLGGARTVYSIPMMVSNLLGLNPVKEAIIEASRSATEAAVKAMLVEAVPEKMFSEDGTGSCDSYVQGWNDARDAISKRGEELMKGV